MSKPAAWHVDPDLGKIPDVEIARRHGVGTSTVHIYRKRHGIDLNVEFRPPKHREWHDDPDIGRIPDAEFAQRYGLSRVTVHAWRRANGIEQQANRKTEADQERQAAIKAALQQNPSASPRELADALGAAPDTVRSLRKEMGIVVPPSQTDEIKRLHAQGKTTAQIAELVGTTYHTVYGTLYRLGLST